MRAIIISFFNSSNIGDCILSNCLFDLFSDGFICDKVSYSLSPFMYTDLHNICPVTLNLGAGLKSKALSILIKAKLFKAVELYYWNKQYLCLTDKEKLNNIISQSDIVIIGGGNMIFDLEDGSLSAGRFKYFATIARKYHKPIIACCIGIGPFKRKQQLSKAIYALNLSDYVSFRDERSYRLFVNNNGKNGALSTDPAFLLSFKKKNNELKEYIAINVIDPILFTADTMLHENIKAAYIGMIDALSKIHGNILLFTTDVRDYQFAKDIAIRTKATIYNINSIDLLYKVYEKTKLVIGSRMHSMITAFTQRIPIIGFEWQDKVGALFDYLEISDYCHSIYDFDIETIRLQVISILNGETVQKKEFIDAKIRLQKDILSNNIEIALRIASKENDGK